MSQENVELTRQALEALSRRDRTTWLAFHDDDFEVVPIGDFPEAGVRGPGPAWDFYLKNFEAFERVPLDDTEVLDAGADKVLVHQRYDLRGRGSGAVVEFLRGRGSGAVVEFDYWVVVTVRQGRILRAQWFTDRVDALEAAGLRE
jgi:ketosteroid isomerase-like protein